MSTSVALIFIERHDRIVTSTAALSLRRWSCQRLLPDSGLRFYIIDEAVRVLYAHPMGRKHTDKQVQQRLDVIEECLTRGEWTLRRQGQVASTFNVSPAQVRKDAAAIRRAWSQQDQEQSVDELRSDWRQRVHKAIREASTVGHTHTVAKLLATEARVLGLEAPVQVDVSHQVTHTIEDAPMLAARVIQALPGACQVLGIEAPRLPVIDLPIQESDDG